MNELKPAVLMLLLLTVICGGLYPAVVTGIAQAVFPQQADGSFIVDRSGRTIGSTLIGQPFSDPKYFWSRPSATAGNAYNPLASGGANAGPTNADYLAAVRERVKVLRASGVVGPIPADMAQASASGLDPHITPDMAKIQIPRIARDRRISESELATLVAAYTEKPQLGIFGVPKVNVLKLNLALDEIKAEAGRSTTEH
jgi:K+-transporting ATPase ATPase C chain